MADIAILKSIRQHWTSAISASGSGAASVSNTSGAGCSAMDPIATGSDWDIENGIARFSPLHSRYMMMTLHFMYKVTFTSPLQTQVRTRVRVYRQ